VGINFYEHLTRIRLRHAIHELNTTSKSLTEIALDSGFPDSKAFSRYFKRNFQKSPSQYRSEVKNEAVSLIFENQRNYLPIGTGNIEQKLEEYLCRGSFNVIASETPEERKEQSPESNNRMLRQEVSRLCQELLELVKEE